MSRAQASDVDINRTQICQPLAMASLCGVRIRLKELVNSCGGWLLLGLSDSSRMTSLALRVWFITSWTSLVFVTYANRSAGVLEITESSCLSFVLPSTAGDLELTEQSGLLKNETTKNVTPTSTVANGALEHVCIVFISCSQQTVVIHKSTNQSELI